MKLNRILAIGKSLIYKKNKRVPRIDPWGTPAVVMEISDSVPLMSTNCLRLVKYFLINLSATPCMPQYFNLCNNIWWSSVKSF